MQYHYVGLDKIPEQPQPTIPVQPAQPEPVAEQPDSVSDNELDDATIEEGDEQVSGAPQASMMCVENRESLDIATMCVAPAEGERPQNINNFEAMSNPDKFPYGTGSDRPRKLTYSSIKGYWMLMADLLETLTICLLHSILLKLSKY